MFQSINSLSQAFNSSRSVPKAEKQDMRLVQLNYRGASYRVNLPQFEATDSEVIGLYRGAQLRRQKFSLKLQESQRIKLQFLGNSYCL